MNDSELARRLAEYRAMAATYALEEGYLKKSDGSFQPPYAKEIRNIYFSYSGKYTEALHIHVQMFGGAHYFSAGDIFELHKIFSGGHMEDVSSFNYIVVAGYAAGALQVSDSAAFASFGAKYFSSEEGINAFKDIMDDAIPKEGPVPDVMVFQYAVANFIRVLQQENTGLTFLERYLSEEAEDDSWRVKDISGLFSIEIPCP